MGNHGRAVFTWETMTGQFIYGKPWQCSLSMGNVTVQFIHGKHDSAVYPWETMVNSYTWDRHGRAATVIHRNCDGASYPWEAMIEQLTNGKPFFNGIPWQNSLSMGYHDCEESYLWETMIDQFSMGCQDYPWDTMIEQFTQGKPWSSSLYIGNHDKVIHGKLW